MGECHGPDVQDRQTAEQFVCQSYGAEVHAQTPRGSINPADNVPCSPCDPGRYWETVVDFSPDRAAPMDTRVEQRVQAFKKSVDASIEEFREDPEAARRFLVSTGMYRYRDGGTSGPVEFVPRVEPSNVNGRPPSSSGRK